VRSIAKLEAVVRGARVEGILPSQQVEIVDAKWQGADVLSVVYRDQQGHTQPTLLFREQEDGLRLATREPQSRRFDADPAMFRLVGEAQRISLAYLFDPLLAVHTSLVRPLPHQITAVYEEMLARHPLKFLLADDPGSGKTIMAGLLIKELAARDDLRRCLVCAPGSLAEQWQEELASKFGLRFEIVTRDAIEADLAGNPFASNDLVIGRMDHLSRSDSIMARLSNVEWDLVVVDEAHKMSCPWYGDEPKPTKRYNLGQLLARQTRHLLLMTATPHNGKDEDFQSFLQLLDSERFAGRPRRRTRIDAHDLMRRMTKESLVTFEGTPLFPERRAYTPKYALTPEERVLYESVTKYVSDEMNRVERLHRVGRGSQGAIVGFAMTTLQRRLASSPEAIFQSLSLSFRAAVTPEDSSPSVR
jgi:SNF2 family DNA or RNA helicase